MSTKPLSRLQKAAPQSASDADGNTSVIEAKAFVETPSVVHGRLLESTYITGFTLERATGELIWLLDNDRWKSVGSGFDDINDFLATVDVSTFRIIKDQRREIAKMLDAIGASQRATAQVLGVDQATISRDLSDANASSSGESHKETVSALAASDANASPAAPQDGVHATVAAEPVEESDPKPWFQRDVDPTKLAKSQEKQEVKKGERRALAAGLTAKNVPLPIGKRKYGAICPDPAWFFKVGSEQGKDRSVENHYPTMTIEEIKALPVAGLAADDCVLLLWVTMPFLEMAFDVIKAWGFKYKTCGFVWVKTTLGDEEEEDEDEEEPTPATGMGYWTRSNAELCLLATRGNPMRINADVNQIVMAPRLAHSQKPDEVYDRIRRLVPGPYLEMFARKAREGWDAWGNEAEASPADLPPNWDGHGDESQAPTPKDDDFPDLPPSLRRTA